MQVIVFRNIPAYLYHNSQRVCPNWLQLYHDKTAAMKTILIPVDYSPGSTSALLYGLKMARKAHLKVVVLHAFYYIVSPPAAYDVPSFISELEAEKTGELEKYVKASLDAPTDELILRYSRVKDAEEGEGPVPPYHAVAVKEVTQKGYAEHVTCLVKLGAVYE